MKFQDIKYTRPNFDELLKQLNDLVDKMANASSSEEFFDFHKQITQKSMEYQEMYTLASIRNTINTKDAFYEEEMKLFIENSPRFEEVENKLQNARLVSPYRKEFEDKYGKMITAKDELQKDIFKPSIIEDRVKEATLVKKYQKLMGSAQINFRGETYNIAQLGAFTESMDRETRKEAFAELNKWMASHKDEFDQIYDELVKIRTQIANKLGFETYTPVAYKSMGRVDWDMHDAKKYRDQIAKYIVPLTQKLYKEQKKRIGISDFKYYDVPLKFLTGNPKPMDEEKIMVEKAQKMYHELSPETDEFFQKMVEGEMMDLSTKDGKAPGGYMTSLPITKMPFIFSNFNGTLGDVDVLTHEAGHAFQGYLTRDIYPVENQMGGMEIAETHSMSMEFFTTPWMPLFFGDSAEKYYYQHLSAALEFLPYGASIDEFQEFVYENPNATPAERNAKYREIEKKYLPHIDYDGNEYLESGARWQRQLHVFHYPFYYLDYTIAQINAFQFFIKDLENHEDAWNRYLKLCNLGGSLGTKDILKEVGLEVPFDEGVIGKITPKLEKYLDSLDKEKIK